MSDIIVPQSDVKLCTRNVNLYYGENHALKDINLYGAILGKAYYIGAVDLKEAVEVAK